MPAEEFATQIAATFGTQPKRVGQEYRVFCPSHEADGGMHKPSLAIWDKGGGRCAWKCMTGCSKETVKAALKARGIKTPGAGPVTTEQMLATAQADAARHLDSLRKAQHSYLNSTDIKPGDPVDVYLKSRAIDISTIPGMSTLRTSIEDDEAFLVGVIADLTTLRDDSRKAKGITTLSLNLDGTPRLAPDGKKYRSIVGTQKGFGVPFGVPGPHLVVAEGIETMLSAMLLLKIPFGVAVLSSANMASLAVPSWVERVTIAADADEPGCTAAAGLFAELHGTGVRTNIAGWGEAGSGWDANDELRRVHAAR